MYRLYETKIHTTHIVYPENYQVIPPYYKFVTATYPALQNMLNMWQIK